MKFKTAHHRISCRSEPLPVVRTSSIQAACLYRFCKLSSCNSPWYELARAQHKRRDGWEQGLLLPRREPGSATHDAPVAARSPGRRVPACRRRRARLAPRLHVQGCTCAARCRLASNAHDPPAGRAHALSLHGVAQAAERGACRAAAGASRRPAAAGFRRPSGRIARTRR
jgi:hypothetical protein